MTKVLVTGSSDGIGKQAAIELARAGAQVVVHGRNQARADEAAQAVPGAESWASVYLALSKEVEGITGRYFINRRETRPAPQALDDEAAQRPWDVSERLSRI